MPKVYKDRNRILHFTTVIFKINSPTCIKKKEWKKYIYIIVRWKNYEYYEANKDMWKKFKLYRSIRMIIYNFRNCVC